MKKQILLAAAVFLVNFAFGQSKFESWPEMKSYSTLLAETYKPAQDGDLKLIRKRSHELLADCKLVIASPLPQSCSQDDNMKKLLKRLEKDTDKLNSFIVMQEQSASIMKQLEVVNKTTSEVEALYKKKQ